MTFADDPFWTPYSSTFYMEQSEARELFEERALVDSIVKTLGPIDVLDVGCGRGEYLRRFHELIIAAHGIEGKELDFVVPRKAVWVRDLRNSHGPFHGYDTLLCLEVVEPLPEECADILVKDLAKSDARVIVFSGARPGQGGTGHINERPAEHWEREFAKHGRHPREDLRTDILDRWLVDIQVPRKLWFLSENLRVFA